MPILYRLAEPAAIFLKHHLVAPICLAVILASLWGGLVYGMTADESRKLRLETIDVFYHGFDNYMEHAFPEDELKPVSCIALTRDRANPAHIEVNDVLGNYSLTLIDSLSTLAILASAPEIEDSHRKPFQDFQDGVSVLVKLYGDGTNGPNGQGTRSRGFDLDSKVQVFETVIRGVGGLLSAHLFAIGELPITNYTPNFQNHTVSSGESTEGIQWENDFVYDGQLLRLAQDLGGRLLPAFNTVTGLPYPRVNLRHGVPFYTNSPLNWDAEHGQCHQSDRESPEITETCSAGAGSLVLEFTTLSRLTGLCEFENAARRAFWAVWERRSEVGLIGAGVDAETGHWVNSYTGIGAGIDSFFEYALKTHILLAGSPNILSPDDNKSEADFLTVWQDAHLGIKRHLYRSSAYQHPHYIQADLFTGATRAFWIDSLSAYYPGLLTLGGQVEEAVETHLLYTALWSRYSALPERWSTSSGKIDAGLRWWGGRPEFIESTWYLYQATRDPWYLHVGEMALRDIQRRCWTPCGWAGLEDVRTGELKDRMESFFLGETVQYLYLLFDPAHPLNTLDGPVVFTTEGHPLVIPKSNLAKVPQSIRHTPTTSNTQQHRKPMPTCPAPPALIPFTISAMASRNDIFHAASLARLDNSPKVGQSTETSEELVLDHPSRIHNHSNSPTNYTFFPWTLPLHYVPINGTSSPMENRETFDLSFPSIPDSLMGALTMQRVDDGVLLTSISSLKVGLTKELAKADSGEDGQVTEVYRLSSVAHLYLGRDEKVYVTREALKGLNPTDQYFTKNRDLSVLDVVIDMAAPKLKSHPSWITEKLADAAKKVLTNSSDSVLDAYPQLLESLKVAETGNFFNNLLQHLSTALDQRAAPIQTQESTARAKLRRQLAASTAVGVGAAPIPDVPDASSTGNESLIWNSIYSSDETCFNRLPADVARKHQVMIIKRGDCSFADKLRNIPAMASTNNALQLVILVSYPEQEAPPNPEKGSSMQAAAPYLRPLLDEVQQTPNGLPRAHPIPLVVVEGGDESYELLSKAVGIGLKRRYFYSSQGLRMTNLVVL